MKKNCNSLFAMEVLLIKNEQDLIFKSKSSSVLRKHKKKQQTTALLLILLKVIL